MPAAHLAVGRSNPATFADPNPVGTGPYMLDKFSPQGYTLKQNPNYWNKAAVHVPAISSRPSQQLNIVQPAVQRPDRLRRATPSPTSRRTSWPRARTNHTWYAKAPFVHRQQRGDAVPQHHKAPLNDPAVRQAISFGINRQQLSTQGETGYEPPATSTSGLLLPSANSYLDPSLANDLPADRRPGQGARPSRPTAGRRSTASGPRTGKRSTSRSTTRPLHRLLHRRPADRAPAQRPGLRRHRQRHRQPDRVGRLPDQRQRSTPRSTGATRARTRTTSTTTGWTLESAPRSASRPPATSAGSQPGRRRPRCSSSPATGDAAGQQAAIIKLQKIMDHPGAGGPAAVRRGLVRVLHQELHRAGRPPDNQYMNPVPNSPYI